MALDPRIPLQTQVGNTVLDVGQIGQSFQNSLLALGQAKRASQAADRDAALQPLREQLLRQQVAQSQQATLQQAQQTNLIAEARTAKDLVTRLDAGDDIGVAGILGTNPHGVSPDALAQANNLFQNAPDQFRAILDDRIRAGQQIGAFGTTTTERFSPKTDILDDGTVVQTTSTGSINVTDPSGIALEGADRQEAIIRARDVGVEEQRLRSGARKGAAAAVKQGEKAFEKIPSLQEGIGLYDDAVNLVQNEGANTGVIASRLPSLKQSAVKLDNLQKRLGLNVIQNTTFGALSENELRFALDSALPTGLEGNDLVEWLNSKKSTQQKLLNYTQEAAQFLSSGKHTIADFIQLQRARSVNRDGQQAQPIPQQELPQPAAQPTIIQFDAQGNQI